MGVVYAARDTELARRVALKFVRPRSDVEMMAARLRREATAMARLSHPNVVPVFDIGTHDGQLFIAMELVVGPTLRSWVTEPRPWRRVASRFVKAGRGLDTAYAAGLIHRDVKQGGRLTVSATDCRPSLDPYPTPSVAPRYGGGE
jgi:serine/threonine protein kinase